MGLPFKPVVREMEERILKLDKHQFIAQIAPVVLPGPPYTSRRRRSSQGRACAHLQARARIFPARRA